MYGIKPVCMLILFLLFMRRIFKAGTKNMWELLQNLMNIKDYILKSDFKEQINLAKTFECAMNLAFTK